MNTQHCFIVDVEATDKTPMTGVMTEFAVAHMGSEDTFYAHLVSSNPHPDIPALPVAVTGADGRPLSDVYVVLNGKDRAHALPDVETPYDVVSALESWLEARSEGKRPVFVSDNNGYDAMWLNCFTDDAAGTVVFGHSSRRIGDFHAGLRRKWSGASSWKRLRRTAHTHHPVDDAVGNREALRALLNLE